MSLMQKNSIKYKCKHKNTKCEKTKYEKPKYEKPKCENCKYENCKCEKPKCENCKYENCKCEHSKCEHSKCEHSKCEHSKCKHSKCEHCKCEHCKCDKHKPIIALIGVGCGGSYLLNKLSKKYKIEAFEAGWDRRYDGFSYNLALAAPTSHSQFDRVAPSNMAYPVTPTQWSGITTQQPWTIATTTNPAYPPYISTQNWNQGIMLGGSNEHIQGVYVNPSRSRCDWWAKLLDDRYKFENLFPLLTEMEKFRSHTDLTSQTYDGTTYGPLDGPSELGSKPIHRGYDGVIQVVQEVPSPYSLSLAKAVYNHFHDIIGYEKFKIVPIIEDKNSETFNSGVNICVTTATETFLDIHRVRSSIARAYLNPSVMTNTQPNLPADASSGYAGTYSGYVNNGIYKGINNHNFNLTLNTLIQRIVFETKFGYPHGKDYWLHNYTVNQIDVNAFKMPLRAIGVEYGTGANLATRVFVPCTDVICSLGVLGTPALLMQSGIGPSDVLLALGIPQLFIQSNMGKHISNHGGATVRWTGNATVWGNNPVGTQNSNGYLPGPDSTIRRKFQYFSSATPALTPTNWSINLYDLNSKSTGFIKANQNWDTDGNLLNVSIFPQYFSDPMQEDIHNLCWIVRQIAASVIAADPTAVFTAPASTYPFPADDNVLFPLIVANFTAQAHYVGSCGMGHNPDIHCVDAQFLLRGTTNVRVCDASSTPLDTDCNGNIFPVQNDGNTSRTVNVLSVICADQLLKLLN